LWRRLEILGASGSLVGKANWRAGAVPLRVEVSDFVVNSQRSLRQQLATHAIDSVDRMPE